MWIQAGATGRCWMGRLPFQGDLLLSIEAFAREEKIRAARVEIIGAVEKAVLAYYDQHLRSYKSFTLQKSMEIVSCLGNISIKDGSPKAHLHVALGDASGELRGGHLQEGTIVFAGEYFIQEVAGPVLEREEDEQTGLPLWRR